MDLEAAIRLIKRVTPKADPWTGADISEDAKTATDTDDAIAAILNAVVAGELVLPATECPFGDDSTDEAKMAGRLLTIARAALARKGGE